MSYCSQKSAVELISSQSDKPNPTDSTGSYGMRPDKLEINQGKFKVLHVVKEIKAKDTGRQEVQGKQAIAAEIEFHG